MALLPRDQDRGWTPYAYPVYLGMFFFEPLAIRSFSMLEWTAQILVTLLFLTLYFRGFWVRGRRLYPIIAGIVVLAVISSSFNSFGTVFFIYAAGFLGEVGPVRHGVAGIVSILAVIVASIFGLQLHPGSWIPAVVFTVLIGGLNIHYARVGRRNARLRMAQEEVERVAKSDERERISRDLHDLLGHTLSIVTLKSELAARLLEQIEDPEPVVGRVLGEIRDVEEISRQAMTEVRSAIRGFRSFRIGTEIAKARVALAAANVELRFEGSPFDLPDDFESVLALALRESVTNVVRHARATETRISLSTTERGTHLEISDDGRGIRGGEGSGLRGMRERVEGVGGTLEVANRQPRGTTVIVSLPKPPDSRRSRRSDAAAESPSSATNLSA